MGLDDAGISMPLSRTAFLHEVVEHLHLIPGLAHNLDRIVLCRLLLLERSLELQVRADSAQYPTPIIQGDHLPPRPQHAGRTKTQTVLGLLEGPAPISRSQVGKRLPEHDRHGGRWDAARALPNVSKKAGGEPTDRKPG